MTSTELPRPDYVRNMRLVRYSDQGGRPDGVQIMVQDGYAYIDHMFSNGFLIVDVRDPKNPKPVTYIPAPPGTSSLHLQAHDGLLLVINGKNLYLDPLLVDEKVYYSGSMAEKTVLPGPAEATARASGFLTSPTDRSRTNYRSCQSKPSALIDFGM